MAAPIQYAAPAEAATRKVTARELIQRVAAAAAARLTHDAIKAAGAQCQGCIAIRVTAMTSSGINSSAAIVTAPRVTGCRDTAGARRSANRLQSRAIKAATIPPMPGRFQHQ